MQGILDRGGIKYGGGEIGEFISSFWFKTEPGAVSDPKIACHILIDQRNGIFRKAFFIGVIMPECVETVAIEFLQAIGRSDPQKALLIEMKVIDRVKA